MAIPRSHKGMVAAIVLTAAAAAAGAYLFYQSRQESAASGQEAPPPPAAVALPAALPTTAPPAPDKTVIRFDSRPAGAIVVRKDSGEGIGTTPFDYSVPHGETPLEFTFEKPGFEKASLSVLPKTPSVTLSANMIPESAAPPAGEPVAGRPASRPPSTNRPAPLRIHPPAPRARKPPRPTNDEDGVLEPSFFK
jgi:hypothetical protein